MGFFPNLKPLIDQLFTSKFDKPTGTNLQYIAGDGSLITFPTFLSSDSLIATMFNQTGSTVPSFSVVYINGVHGNLPSLALAKADAENTSSKTYAITSESISNNNSGGVITEGKLKSINTSAFNEGDSLWLSPTTAGGVTTTKPSAPNHAVFLGTVTRVHTNQGEVQVRIQNGFELQELHNVSIDTLSDSQTLVYDNATSLWKNSSKYIDWFTFIWNLFTGFTIAELRLLTNSQLALVSSFSCKEEGRIKDWYYDSTDTTSTDNNGTVLVTSSGKRLKATNYFYQSPESFGAIGNNIADDTNAINNAISSLPENGTLVLGKNKTYKVTNYIVGTKNIKILGNNSSIVASGNSLLDSSDSVIKIKNQKYNYTSFTPFNSEKGSNKFDIPTGLNILKGDLVFFGSNDAYLTYTNTSFNYYHGQWAIIDNVIENVAYISSPFYDVFNINNIKIYTPICCEISNLKIDVTNIQSTQKGLSGISVTGVNSKIQNCELIGNDYSLMGIYTEGENFVINNNKITGFLNVQGIADGGRLGYGVCISANNTLVDNNSIYNCKHNITASTGSRKGKIRKVKITYNTCYEDPTKTSDTYAGTIDAHASVSDDVIIEYNNVFAHSTAFFIRNGKAIIKNNNVYQYDSTYTLLAIDEQNLDKLIFNNNDVVLSTEGIIYNTVGSSYSGVNIKNLFIENNNVTNGSIVRVTNGSLPISLLSVKNNIHKNAKSLIYFNLSTSNIEIDRLYICGNIATSRLTSNIENLVFISSNVADSRGKTFRNLFVNDNILDCTLNTGTAYALALNDAVFVSCEVKNNKIKRGNNNFRGISLARGSYENIIIDQNEMDNGSFLTITSLVENVILNNVSISNNTIFSMSVSESTGYIAFKNSSIKNNTFFASGGTIPITFTFASGSSGWANSTELPITGNIMTGNSSISISINNNSTNNKLVINNNVLNNQIVDSSGTFYKIPIGNILRSGTQSWKGNTVVDYNGTLYSSAIPTTGTWAYRDTIYNSNPVSGGYTGWICVTAGTPGTWKTFGLIS